MATPRRGDFERALIVLRDLADEAETGEAFARAGVRVLPGLVASEMTTLSICDLRRGHRSVISAPGQALSAADRACFDRYFPKHPLVRYHADHAGGRSHRISDSIPWSRFRSSELYQEYYRRVGIDHVVAVPLYVDRELLVSFVFNRGRRDFTAREMRLLELMRPPLARLYHQFLALERLQAWVRELGSAPDSGHDPAAGSGAGNAPRLDHRAGLETTALTARERTVVCRVASGKTDAEVAAILGISPRTVHKHLEHVYVKLGVETRTAAVMRSMGWLQAPAS